jgi:hypothetical protein
MAAEVAVVGSNPGGSTPWAIIRDPPRTGFWAWAFMAKKVAAKPIKNTERNLFMASSSNPPQPPFSKGGRGAINFFESLSKSSSIVKPHGKLKLFQRLDLIFE